MRNLFPVFLFLGLIGGGLALQHEAGARRHALEEAVGGARVGVSLETCAAYHRLLEDPQPGEPPFSSSLEHDASIDDSILGQAVGAKDGEDPSLPVGTGALDRAGLTTSPFRR